MLILPILSENCNRTINLKETIFSPTFDPSKDNLPFSCWYKVKQLPVKSNTIFKLSFERFKIGVLGNDSCLLGHMQVDFCLSGYQPLDVMLS